MDETQTTIHSYNQNAKAYADKFMCHEPYTKQAKAFAELLRSGDSVLDIGGNKVASAHWRRSL